MARKEYKLTEEQFIRLMDACKPVPYIVAGGMEPSSPQESVNRVWQSLADELGFVWDTVRPVSGKPEIYFTAEEA